MEHEVYVECQDCGERVRGPLGPSQIKDLIERPYDYVVYCFRCLSERKKSRTRVLDGWL